jgi:L-ascorbate peroxidase
VDALAPDQCCPEGNLPDGEAGGSGKYGGTGGTASTESDTAAGHLRKVFHRMGLDDEDIVALSGAHTFGRAYKDRSGAGAEKTKFTDGSKQTLVDGSDASYKPGGSSWTPQFLVFDNSYYQITEEAQMGTPRDTELLSLSTDKAIFVDPQFKPFAEKFRDSQEAFFESYAKSHKKLSELGSKFDPEGGITL